MLCVKVARWPTWGMPYRSRYMSESLLGRDSNRIVGKREEALPDLSRSSPGTLITLPFTRYLAELHAAVITPATRIQST